VRVKASILIGFKSLTQSKRISVALTLSPGEAEDFISVEVVIEGVLA
jgi:hypothetical protein